MAYEKMKKGVQTAVPQFIQPLSVKATAAQKRGGLKALDAITELFGKGGKHWVQGHYHSLEEGFDTFCLSGAFNKVDGEYEAVARAAISVAIVELYGSDLADHGDCYFLPPNPKEVGNESTIVSFNDSGIVDWEDVKRVLKRARKLLS